MQPESHQELHNKVGAQGPAKHLVEFELESFPFSV